MKVLTHEEKLNEIHDSAEMFLEMQAGLPTDREEMVAMLVCFASGEIMQLNEHNKALSWAAKWIEDGGAATKSKEIKSFASNMAMTLRSVMQRDEPDAELIAKTKIIADKALAKYIQTATSSKEAKTENEIQFCEECEDHIRTVDGYTSCSCEDSGINNPDNYCRRCEQRATDCSRSQGFAYDERDI